MSLRIWKYPAPTPQHAEAQLSLPQGARFLSMQLQVTEKCELGTGIGRVVSPAMWFLVDELSPKEFRLFRLFGTGQPLPDWIGAATYLGTYQHINYVWHIFEIPGEFTETASITEVDC